LLQAQEITMQIRTTTGELCPHVGDDDTVDAYDTLEFRFRSRLPAAHAGAHGRR
jgi:hypothetical protein